MGRMKYLENEFESALLALDRSAAEEIIGKATEIATPFEVATELITDTLFKIGKKWEEGIIALSQVYMSGLICEESIDRILPPSSEHRLHQPVMAIGVYEDYHLLGKRIVYSALRASGFEIIDLGNGLTKEQVLQYVKEKNIKILLLSTLMLPSALRIKKLTEELAGSGVKVIVGGAPFRFDKGLWKEVGADAMGENPTDAIVTIKSFIGEN